MSLSNLGLDAFLSVHKHKTVVEASRHLGITATGVTQRIRALENELGTTLFIRSKKGMLLTDSGHKLLTYCQQKEGLESEVISLIKNESIETPVRIKVSASTYFMGAQVLPIATRHKAEFPSIYFSFNVNDNDDKVYQLKRNEADFVILQRHEVPLELDSKLLKKRRYILVGGKKAAKRKNDFTIIDFSEKDPFTEEFFRKLKVPLDPKKERHFLNNTMLFPKLLEDDLGVAVLDEEHFLEIKKNYSVYNMFPGKYYDIEWALAWFPRPEMPRYFRQIINLIA